MRIPIALIHLTYLTLAIMAMGLETVRSEPKPMARPTRPKVFTSAEELRRFLDLVKDYYSLNTKARYGKRSDLQHSYEQPLSFLQTLLSVKHREQLGQYEQLNKEDRNKWQILYPYDRITRYY